MRILILGDIVGRSGRDAVVAALPDLRVSHKLDAIIVNADNAAAGFGATPEIVTALLAAGADVITGGDHVWDQKELRPTLAQEPRLLRPMNFPPTAPGRGVGLYTLPDDRKLLVMHPLGQVFIQDKLDCPFAAVDKELQRYRLGSPAVQAIVVDFHAEATSEKMAMGVYLDGRVSAVVGTHTHVPTADARLLPKGTAYMTDLGMCGDYDSVIGFESAAPLAIFTQKIRKTRMTPALKDASLCGAIIETDDRTGLAKTITPIKIGGSL
jgi:metallophosphoesterase (TIGR00282 family)